MPPLGPRRPRRPLREMFNEDAALYDQARPGYPAQLFADLAAAAGLSAGARVLEIGCGTGQATAALATRGYRVVAVELGAELAARARTNLAGFPSVTVVTAAFETWPLPAEAFDLVFAATAFHWVDPAVRVTKSADALRPGGVLATVGTHHVAGGTAEFFVEVQRCYEAYDPATPPGLRLPAGGAVQRDDAELTSSGRFGPVTFHRYEWDASYRTSAYLDLLRTYSNHRALPEAARRRLLDCIGRLVDTRHGGQIVKRYLTDLRIAQRTS